MGKNIWGLQRFGKNLKLARHGFGKGVRVTTAATLMFSIVTLVENGQAFADEKPTMDTVVVTAARQEEKISSVPANVTVIAEKEIARSPAETVPELLRTVAGVVVNDITGNGRNITVDLRGFGETAGLNTLLLIDGRRVNQADLTGVDWTLIPKDRIERIEIIPGGRGSVLYGDNASGGVVNIITKKGGDIHFMGNLAAGSYDSLLTGLGASGSLGKFSYALNGNFRRSDGYRDNSGTKAKDVGVNLEYFATEHFSVTLNSGYHRDDTELPGALLLSDLAGGMSRTASKTPDDFSNTEDYYLQLVPEFYFTDTSFIKLDVSARKKENDAFASFSSGTFDAATDINTLIFSPQVAVNEDIFNIPTKLVAGLDYTRNKENLSNQSVFFGVGSTADFDLSKKNVGVYGNAEVSMTDAMTLSGGYRHDHAQYDSSSSGTTDRVTMDENVYSTGLTYQFSDTCTIYGSYAKSFRYPVLDEMFSFFTNTFDSALGPQTTDHLEIGTRLQFGSGIHLSGNLFRLVTEDEIFYNPVSFANENFDGDTIRQGVELKLSKSFSRVLVSGSYTFRDTEVDGGTYDGKEVPNVPRHQFTAAVDTKLLDSLQLNLAGSYIGERLYISDFANTVESQDSYFYLTAKLSYLFDLGSAYFAVNNLLNEKYSQYGALDFSGSPGVQPSPGINFLVGANFEF